MKMLMILTLFFAVDKEILYYRELLVRSEKNEQVCKLFYETLKNTKSEKPLVLGYKAMSDFMMSKHVANPLSKLSYFKEGKNNLEKAIKADTSNIELRYLRFSVQANLPEFLGYRSQLETDKNKLIAYLKTKNNHDKDLNTRIYNFVSASKLLSIAEKESIKQ